LLKSGSSLQEPANEFDPIAPAKIAGEAHTIRGEAASRRRMVFIGAGIIVALVMIALIAVRSHKSVPSSPPIAQSLAPPPTQTPAPAVTPAPARPSAAPPSVSSGVTAKGAVAQRVMPDVLASANRTIRGKVAVRIRLNVDANGAVSNAGFDVHGSSRYFAAKALEAARRWRFKPALENGRPVPSVWVLQFEFRKSGPEVAAHEVSP
jgi:TonB family protein